jgi:hypothetical protein
MTENFKFTNQEDFNLIKTAAKELYKQVISVACPYFNEPVAFNHKGWGHLMYKNYNYPRPITDQYARLKLLKLAPQVVEKSHTLQGIRKTKEFRRIKTDGTKNKWIKVCNLINFYEFIAILEDVRLKVVVKEDLGMGKYFWSVIPYF